MPDRVAELVQHGLALSPEDRQRLVDRLLESLNEPAASQLDSAWAPEIERRLAEYDRGEVQAVDADEVFAKARRIAQ
ncbi:addiction module protein [Azohydromonas aeria]|uniref:addiction module protein n=1 Tax=Azohydromonas aeria TaxID=2590212 RepID=UPI0012FC9470|nr:addiction module protein [Azohydromonas aeria]